MEKVQTKQKAPYGVLSNVVFMLKTAFGSYKSVPVFVVIEALLSITDSLLSLFFAPAVLSLIQRREPPAALCITVISFAAAMIALRSLSAYCATNHLFGRIGVRSQILRMIGVKAMTTSYSNLEKNEFTTMQARTEKCTQSNSAAAEAIWGTLEQLLKCMLGCIIYVILLSSINFYIASVTLLTTVIGFMLSNSVTMWKYRHKDEEDRHLGRLWYISGECIDIAGAKDIRLFGMQPWLKEMYYKHRMLLRRFQLKGEKRYLLVGCADLVLTALRNGFAYYWLVLLVIRREMTVPEFVLYFAAVGTFTQWINGILSQCSDLYRESLDLSSVLEFLNYPDDFVFETGAAVPLAQENTIELKNVSFSYGESSVPVLDTINLTIKPREKIAVVGLNGAGKTTLIKLITGLYNPTRGQVLINGADVRTLNRRAYYRCFSAVFQEHSLLPLSIAENIAQSADGAADKTKVAECLRKAGLYDKVSTLPHKEDTLLCKEVFPDAAELSGGETQKLLLARALYKESPFLILDEPTAALDPIAEHELYMKYNELTHEKSSLFISHRLASTRFCDRILLLKDGRIAEEGSHEELLRLNGEYAALFAVQSKYYQKAPENDSAKGDADE